MTIEEVQNYFGSLYQACKQLDIKQQNITGWRRKGYIPLLQQYRIAALTEGELLPDEIDPKLTYKKQ